MSAFDPESDKPGRMNSLYFRWIDDIVYSAAVRRRVAKIPPVGARAAQNRAYALASRRRF